VGIAGHDGIACAGHQLAQVDVLQGGLGHTTLAAWNVAILSAS
jgi:hypothetical protein